MSRVDGMATDVYQMDAAQVYRSTVEVCRNIGRLEEKVSQIVGRLDRIEQRLDRLIFALFAFGGTKGAALAAIMAKLFWGG